jgi:hypothetical protein
MAINYQRMAATAKRLLTDNEQGSVSIGRTVITPGVDPWDGPTASIVWTDIKAVVRGVSAQFVDGITVLATDLQVVAYIGDYTPLPGDIMMIDNLNITVINQQKIPAAGIIAAWRFIVRA